MITSYLCDSNAAEVRSEDAEMEDAEMERHSTRTLAFTSLLALRRLNLVKVKAEECSAVVKGLIRNQGK